MRQFLVSAGRIFQSRSLYAVRAAGEKAGLGADIKPVEMPIVERARVKGADRQASQYTKGEEATGNTNQKTSNQADMNAGIGINQSDATTGKTWTESAKEQTRDLKSDNNNKKSKEQDQAAAKAEKQKKADERSAKYPNMPKQESQQNLAPPKEHKETDKITQIINEEHGLPDIGEKKTHKSAPGITSSHEQHGARLGGDDLVNQHQPKMRFDPARSYAENAADFKPARGNIVNTADHQRMQKPERGMADSMRITGAPAEDWSKEMSTPSGQASDAKKTAKSGGQNTTTQKSTKSESQTTGTKSTGKTEGKQQANAAEREVQPQMRGEFGIPSGSPVGGIVNPEKRQRATQDFNHPKDEVKQ